MTTAAAPIGVGKVLWGREWDVVGLADSRSRDTSPTGFSSQKHASSAQETRRTFGKHQGGVREHVDCADLLSALLPFPLVRLRLVPLRRKPAVPARATSSINNASTRSGPDLLQDLDRVVGALRRTWLPRPAPRHSCRRRAWPSRPRSASAGRCHATSPSPRGDRFVEHSALVLLRRLHIRRRAPAGYLGTRRHRQPTSQAPAASPLRGRGLRLT